MFNILISKYYFQGGMVRYGQFKKSGTIVHQETSWTFEICFQNFYPIIRMLNS